ncbi:TBC1 domain family member 7-like [Clytia hemisphaerica]|uniref:TBC1 domain family member 7 n=1 Tax=Clytia hemisphaerica TaxID=252671 RepID=A0A7M5URX0_9CNID
MADNFRMLYYDTLGLKNVDQKKTLELLLSENPLSTDKLKHFSHKFTLPAIYRSLVWKVQLGISPTCKESSEFVNTQRQGHYEDLKQALITMQMLNDHGETNRSNLNPRDIVLMYLLDFGQLSVLHGNILKRDGHKVFVLESISQAVCGVVSDECDCFWITKHLYNRQEQLYESFSKLPQYVKYYSQLEDQRLFEHLCEIQLFKVLPYDRWFQTYFSSVFADCLEYLERILDKIVAGSCNILLFVCVALLLTFSLKLKQVRSSEEALKMISHLQEEAGLAVVDKTMELWEQHRNSLCAEIGCHNHDH